MKDTDHDVFALFSVLVLIERILMVYLSLMIEVTIQ